MNKIDVMRRATALLDQALDMQLDQRNAWLGALDEAEPAVATQLKSLIDAHERLEESDFLETVITPETLARVDVVAAQADEGQHIGPYRLIKQIGEGGMSSVWLAERDYGNFKRRVAMKRLPSLFKSATHEALLQREAAILAKLDHPNIAKFLDAGLANNAANQVEPYIALEYIEGEPITQWCDTHKLSLRARVDLTIQVCEAVAYLHKHSILHRDIKPPNVLIDKDGKVKLLDFGIAKLIGESPALLQPAADAAAAASTSGDLADDATPQSSPATIHAFTPEYAAPEQVKGLTSTTQTDVYSLGVLLYRLLTGCRPYARDTQYLLVASAVVDVPATQPSDLFGKAGKLSALEQQQAAEQRLCSSDQLKERLKGDLDNVLLKALEKESARRYTSVEALAQDLRAWLDYRVVQARPASTWYALQMLVKRHRTASIWLGLAAVSLVIATGFGLWQAQRTQVAAAKTQRVLSFLQTLIAQANPNATGQQTISVLQLLERAPIVAQRQFPDDPNLQYEVLKPVERILRDLEAADSLAPIEKVMLQLSEKSGSVDSEELAELQSEYGMTLVYLGKQDEAEQQMDAALATLDRARLKESVIYAQTLMRRSSLKMFRRDFAGAADTGLQAYALLQKHTEPSDPQRTAQVYDLLEMLLQAERFSEAARAEAADFSDEAIAKVPNEKQRLQFRSMKASMRWYMGDPIKGDQLYAELLKEYERFFGKANVMYPQLVVLNAQTSIEAGYYDKAILLLNEALSIEAMSSEPRARSLVNLQTLKVNALLRQGNLREASSVLASIGASPHAFTHANYWRAKFDYAALTGDWTTADQAIKQRTRLLTLQTGNTIERAYLALDRALLLHMQGAPESLDALKATMNEVRALLPQGHFWRVRCELRYAYLVTLNVAQADEGIQQAKRAQTELIATLGKSHPLTLQAGMLAQSKSGSQLMQPKAQPAEPSNNANNLRLMY
jgi:eukaryotic-like serine/threonine-protein kinase